MIYLALSVLFLVAINVQARVLYNDHQVVSVVPKTNWQLHSLYELMNDEVLNVDFWLDPSEVGSRVDLMLTPADREAVLNRLEELKLKPTIHTLDVQKHLDEALLSAGDDWDSNYHPLEDVNDWIFGLARQHPDIATTFELGQTYEGRTVYGLKVTKAAPGSNPPQIWLDGGIHAREWIAPAVVQHIIGQLVQNYATDSSIQKMVDTAEWYLIPVYNADGYAYTWSDDRLWRKNRQPTKNARCIGTDPCRNGETGFGGGGSSGNPCQETYHGPEPWSVPIVAAWKEYISGLNNVKGYVNFHSYADSWLLPYGYTYTKPADYDKHMVFGKALTDAVRAVHGTRYKYGPAASTIYQASGIPSDWLYDQGVLYSMACELSGNSFSPPASLIKPNGEEIFAGIKVLHSFVLAEDREEKAQLAAQAEQALEY